MAKILIAIIDDDENPTDYDAQDYVLGFPTVTRRDIQLIQVVVDRARLMGLSLGADHEEKLRAIARESRLTAPQAPSLPTIVRELIPDRVPLSRQWFDQDGNVIGVVSIPQPGSVGIQIPQPVQNEPDGL